MVYRAFALSLLTFRHRLPGVNSMRTRPPLVRDTLAPWLRDAIARRVGGAAERLAPTLAFTPSLATPG